MTESSDKRRDVSIECICLLRSIVNTIETGVADVLELKFEVSRDTVQRPTADGLYSVNKLSGIESLKIGIMWFKPPSTR